MNKQQARQNDWRRSFCFACFLALTASAATHQAVAQITPDSSLGAESSTIAPGMVNNNLVDLIQGGAGRGAHLFHSFLELNVGVNQQVYFANPTGIHTIFARITGSAPSNILGQLGVDGNASLFLMNPNGIVFGSNAALDVRGSFVATTAHGILFTNGDRFTTNPTDALPQTALLQIQPSALLFTQQQTQPITVQGQLSVPNGESLLLVGGNVSVSGATLSAPGGQLEIGGLATAGTIALETAPLRLNFSTPAPRSNVQIADSTLEVWASGGGNMTFYARNIDITASAVSAGILENSTAGNLPLAGDITVDATGTVNFTDGSNVFNGVLDFDSNTGDVLTGTGGKITIRAATFSLQSGAQLSTSTFGQGNAGDISLTVKETFALGESTGLRSLVQSGAVGNGGTIRVQTRSLALTDGAQIAASVLPGGSGNGGSVQINATDAIAIAGVDPELTGSNGQPFPSGIFVNNESTVAGNAGDIILNTRRLTLSDQAQIEAITTVGDGGNITLNATDYVLLRRNSSISTTAGTVGAGGNGGNITITAPFVLAVLTEDSDISANAFTGNGGRVSITAQGIYGLQFQAQNTPFSDITASSQFGVGGSVTLNTPEIDPSKSLNTFSLALVDATQQIAIGCAAGSKDSEFVFTGRGGLPSNPAQPFRGDRPLVRLTDLVAGTAQQSNRSGFQHDSQPMAAIVEAQGWRVAADGTVHLVAQEFATIPHHSVGVLTICP